MPDVADRRLMAQTDGVCVSIGRDFDTIDKDSRFVTIADDSFQSKGRTVSFDGVLTLGKDKSWQQTERERQIAAIRAGVKDVLSHREALMLSADEVKELMDFSDSLDKAKEIPAFPLIYELADQYYRDVMQ